MTDDIVAITVVRASFHESSHSHRKQQLHKVLAILRDQLHVHGLMISQGVPGIDLRADGPFETVGDLLRRFPDPRLVIEFFDAPPIAERAKQMLRETFPDVRVLWWPAQCPESNLNPKRSEAAFA